MRLPDGAAQDFAMRLRRQGGAQSSGGFAPGEQNPYGSRGGFNPWGGGFRGGGGFGGWGRQNQGPLPFPQNGPQRGFPGGAVLGGWGRQNQGPLPPQVNIQRPMGGFGGGPYDPTAKPGVITGAQPDFMPYGKGPGGFIQDRFRQYPGGGPGGGINPGGYDGSPQPEGGPYGPPRPPYDENPQDPRDGSGGLGPWRWGGGIPGGGPRNPGPLPPPPPPPRWDGEIEGGPFGPPKPPLDENPQDPGPGFIPYVPSGVWGPNSYGGAPQIPTENPIFPINGPEMGLPYKGFPR